MNPQDAIAPVVEFEESDRPMPVRRLSSVHPVVDGVVAFSRSIPLRNWLIGGAFTVSLIIYMGQWQQPEPSRAIANNSDVRAIPAFDESALRQADFDALDSHERNVSAFLNEERQREAIALAQGFRALAVGFVQDPDHICSGKTTLQCLDTFDANRIKELERLSDGKAGKEKGRSPVAVLAPILAQSSEIKRVEGLRLAKVLSKSPQGRSQWEQDWLDTYYPILNSGIPEDEFRPRPGVLANLLKQSNNLKAQASAGSAEEASRLERCLSLPPEEQPKGGC